MIEELKSLLEKRYHGASNINGVYYQILYSVLISMELFKNKDIILTLEGIEDIDYAKSEFLYIQVKYRENGLSWTNFVGVLKGFTQTYEVDKSRSFQIITNKSFASSIKEFQNNLKKRNKTKKNFIKNPKIALTSEEYDELFNLIDYKIISIEEIEENVINSIIAEWNCLEKTAILIMKKLVFDYIEIAIKRENVDYQLLKSICSNVLEVTSTEEYNAFGKGLIERINWNKTGNEENFYLGKTTQPEHIGHDLDIRREKWLTIIRSSFKKNRTTIIKASSGQGKSALLFRYAKDNGIGETTFIIRKLEDETDVVNIERYLATISKIGLPLLVLIDNLDRNTKLWSKLIARCESKNIDFLISVREEEWYKYLKYSDIEFEIVTPFLDINEAKEIFNLLKTRKLVKEPNLTGIKAFELLGEPELLIEFMFLCTQGKMLEEKLKDQLAELCKSNNSSTRKKIIRYVSLASIVGINLSFKQVRNLINSNDDLIDIIESLKNEYIVINDETISGFHLIRSKHLVELLHTDYLPILETAKELFQYLDCTQLQTFFSNLLIEFNINYDRFLDEFREIINSLSLDKINGLISAIYKAGIYNYVKQNKQMINEAYDLIGFSALSLLAYEIMPKREESGFDSIFNKFPNQGHFPKLKEISQKENKVDSGIEYVKKLIEVSKPVIRSQDYKNIGIFLDWCNYVNYEIAYWDKIKEKMVFKINCENINFENLCHFTLGLYHYDETVYHQFRKINQDELLDFIKLELECCQIELTSDEITIYFIPILSSYPDISDQAVSRLEKIKMLFPYLEKYNSTPKDALLGNLKPSVSSNLKKIESKYLISKLDTKRNSELYKQMVSYKKPVTYYDVQKYWFNLRLKSLTIMKHYSKFIEKQYKGLNPKDEILKKANFDDFWLDVVTLLDHVPYLDKPNKEINANYHNIENILHAKILSGWATSLNNFYRQYIAFKNEKSDSIKLCLHNLKDVNNKFVKFHKFFNEYFENIPDYFKQNTFNQDELKFYNRFYDLLELRYIENVDQFIEYPIKYIHEIRVRRKDHKVNAIKNLISNNEVSVADDYLLEEHLSYIPIVYECSNPLESFNEMIDIIEKLSTMEKEIFHFYWLIPVFNGNRFNDFGYRISYDTIKRLIDDPNDFRWESFMPQEVPEKIINLVPEYKIIIENPEYNAYANSESIKANENFLTNLEKFVSYLPEENKFEKLLKNKYFNKINKIKQEIQAVRMESNQNDKSPKDDQFR
ncbi:hypothetical protein D4R71_08920 [bacterium]|nr:MAG: hypothetical protein D4R71_08920 [bacterium]